MESLKCVYRVHLKGVVIFQIGIVHKKKLYYVFIKYNVLLESEPAALHPFDI